MEGDLTMRKRGHPIMLGDGRSSGWKGMATLDPKELLELGGNDESERGDAGRSTGHDARAVDSDKTVTRPNAFGTQSESCPRHVVPGDVARHAVDHLPFRPELPEPVLPPATFRRFGCVGTWDPPTPPGGCSHHHSVSPVAGTRNPFESCSYRDETPQALSRGGSITSNYDIRGRKAAYTCSRVETQQARSARWRKPGPRCSHGTNVVATAPFGEW
jgi:hypothetical protein